MILHADERVLRALGIVLGPSLGRAVALPPRIDRRGLKSAFRRRAHQLHPDKAHGLGLSEAALANRFRELKVAYDFLVDSLGRHSAIALGDLRDPREARVAPTAVPAPHRARGAAAAAAPPEPTVAGPAVWPPWAQPVQRPSFRHTGGVPRRRLRFAQYLYYAGVIDWATLLAAMRWQHRTRPRIGEIARQLRFLSLDDVCDVLRGKHAEERFGEAALRLRRLDRLHLLTILGRQRKFDRPIGRYFVDHNLLSPEHLAQLLERHWAHNLSCAATEVTERRGVRAAGARRVWAPAGR